jgi:hypothetical protein
MTAGREQSTLLRPGILIPIVLLATLGAYLWWMNLHEPGDLSSTMPFASLLVLMGAAALVAEMASSSVRVFMTAALATTLLVVGYAALMSLGIALLVLAVIEIALAVREVQGLPVIHAIVSTALGASAGGIVTLGFFQWTASVR